MAAQGIPGIVLDGEAMLAVINATLWASIRLGGMLMVAPLFGTRSVPRRVKAMLAIALGFAMAPLAGPPPRCLMSTSVSSSGFSPMSSASRGPCGTRRSRSQYGLCSRNWPYLLR